MKVFAICISVVVSLLSALNTVKAQWVNIPDTNFGTWLYNYHYFACMQGNNAIGWQMDTFCNAVVSTEELNCSGNGLVNLEGLQYFRNLSKLNCAYNAVVSLPLLSNRLLPIVALKYF
jgi:hypothetical protein